MSQLYNAEPDKVSPAPTLPTRVRSVSLTSRSLTTGQAIATLEDAITFSPSAALIEPVIFNLTTLYELRLGAAQAAEKKLDLLVKVRRSLPLPLVPRSWVRAMLTTPSTRVDVTEGRSVGR